MHLDVIGRLELRKWTLLNGDIFNLSKYEGWILFFQRHALGQILKVRSRVKGGAGQFL
jgi:hypothetical protein